MRLLRKDTRLTRSDTRLNGKPDAILDKRHATLQKRDAILEKRDTTLQKKDATFEKRDAFVDDARKTKSVCLSSNEPGISRFELRHANSKYIVIFLLIRLRGLSCLRTLMGGASLRRFSNSGSWCNHFVHVFSQF